MRDHRIASGDLRNTVMVFLLVLALFFAVTPVNVAPDAIARSDSWPCSRRRNRVSSRPLIRRSFMRVARLSATLACAAVLLTARVTAQTPLKPIQFSDTRLANGLRVIISEDHFAPVYAIAVSYGV